MRDSALSAAALTSEAQASRTAGATPSAGNDEPSREEVQQRINSLYNQAETATGTYNATRATTTGSRQRGNPAPGNGRPRTDPALDNNVAKRWFDVGRARLGPTVPARLPADRMPNRAANARPTGPAGRPQDERTGRGREVTGSRVPELTAGPAAGVPTGPVAELTAGPMAALPVAQEAHQGEATKALPALAIEPPHTSLRTSKEQIQQKLATARGLLSKHAAQQSAQLPAIEPRAEDTWRTSEEQAPRQAGEEWLWQQPAGLGADMAVDTANTTVDTAYASVDAAYTSFDAALTTSAAAHSTGAAAFISTGSGSESGYGRKGAEAVAFARGQIGRPCVWGATGPDSYDCSGLTQSAWKAAGVALPRTVHDQASAGTAVALADMQPGDLIFFSGDVGHVGLYTGNSMMIHAPSPGASIREESIFYAGSSAIHSAVRPA
ncbi:NlpC/P60 family protein [Streptomyces sp. NPDC048275]|uniref:C40 family peptidase n=1 Tax=Streptomyces sp. NPDC048275 TaxID=3155629 RepID=UPI0033D5CBC7